MESTKPRVFQAEVKEVISGDDLILMVDLGADDLHKRQRIRLKDVDTPNAVRQSPETEAGKVRDKVAELCRDRKVTITLNHKTANAWVVTLTVLLPDGTGVNLNEVLIRDGYAYGRNKDG